MRWFVCARACAHNIDDNRIFRFLQSFTIVYYANQRMLRNAQATIPREMRGKKFRTGRYTLSERYTLTETFRVLRLLKRVRKVYSCCIIVTIAVCLAIFARTNYTQRGVSWCAQKK